MMQPDEEEGNQEAEENINPPSGTGPTEQKSIDTTSLPYNIVPSSLEEEEEVLHQEEANLSIKMVVNCCRGFNPRLLFLMGSAMIEYIAHTIMLILSPLLVLHFYPNTAIGRVGFYTALLSGIGYLGHCLSCRLWINIARSLKSSKGVILWGLAIIGTGFFGLILCQTFLSMVLVRFAIGLFSGVTPVALIEIDEICGNRQSTMAAMTKYMGTAIGSSVVFLIFMFGDHFFKNPTHHNVSSLYFYCLTFVSMIAWIAVVVILIGLRLKSRSASYMQLGGDEDFLLTNKASPVQSTALDASPVASSSNTNSTTSNIKPLEAVKSAFEETFRLNLNKAKKFLSQPRPHFKMIREILPHYFNGYTKAGNHLIVWDFLGQIKMDKLHTAGFTTVDIREHYVFFLQFGITKLLSKSTQKLVYVIDLEGLSLADADERTVESACSILKELQKKFPDRLHKMIIINAPVWFAQVMTPIRLQTDKKTMDKVLFVRKQQTNEKLLENIGMDSLPRRFGGRSDVEMTKSFEEKALLELLSQTTGSLEKTIEMVPAHLTSTGNNSSRKRGGRRNSVSSGGGNDSDEEAFFDCSEYGLQEQDDEFDTMPITLVIDQQLQQEPQSHNTGVSSAVKTNPSSGGLVPRSSPADRQNVNNNNEWDLESGKDTTGTADTFDESTSTSTTSSSSNGDAFSAIMREPQSCLILALFFLWMIIQSSFDEIFPLWYLNRHIASMSDDAKAIPLTETLPSIIKHIAATLAIASGTFCLYQVFVCTMSSNIMTPRATLRLGLIFQIPIIAGFPMIDVLHLQQLPLGSVILVASLVLKHIIGAIALHGLLTLLDNSIAVDRRLVVHRASHVVKYAAIFLGTAATPALFSLLLYFDKSFPFDQSCLFFIQAAGLIGLLFVSLILPSRLNFPQLFTMGKR